MSDAKRQPIVIERTYKAKVTELWELWTTKEGFESWWGPEGFRADVRTMEAREGGKFHYDMVADTPEMVAAMKEMGRPPSHESRGHFGEFKPYDRLTLIHVVDFFPGVEPYDSTIAVDFFPSGEFVRMVTTLHPMHSEDFSNMQKEGYTSQLTKLDKRFGAAKA